MVDLLDGTLDLVAVGVGGGVRDVGVKETEWGGEGAAVGFRVRAECCDMVASGVVGGDQFFEIYPERSSIAMRASVSPPTEAVVSCWRSKC